MPLNRLKIDVNIDNRDKMFACTGTWIHVTRVYTSVNWGIMGSGNGLSPVRRQTMNGIDSDLFSFQPLRSFQCNFILTRHFVYVWSSLQISSHFVPMHQGKPKSSMVVGFYVSTTLEIRNFELRLTMRHLSWQIYKFNVDQVSLSRQKWVISSNQKLCHIFELCQMWWKYYQC